MAETKANRSGDETEVEPPFTGIQQITTTPTIDGNPVTPPPIAPSPDETAGQTAAMGAAVANGAASPTEVEQEAGGAGTDGEVAVWEARYSLKNFAGRILLRIALTVGWIALAVYTWGGFGAEQIALVTWGLGAAVLVFWGVLFARITQAQFGHYYRLTNRRLFISTGLMRRRRDQMELLRVKDVFTRQSLLERWMSVGTVVVVSTEKELPVFYIAGIDDPKGVMDLIWDRARRERDTRSTKVDAV